jgi:hypothetical protein
MPWAQVRTGLPALPHYRQHAQDMLQRSVLYMVTEASPL